MMILFERPRCRQNEVKIENGNIVVNHFNEIIKINDIEFGEYFYETSGTREYIKDLLDVDYGYCPDYLKNKIKSIRVKYLDEEDDSIYDELKRDISNNWYLYLSLYRDKELVDIFLKFGKSIYKNIKLEKDFLDLFLNQEYDKCYPYFMDKLISINVVILKNYINKLTCMVGIPVDLFTTNDGEVYSYWNNLIYISTMLYIVTLLSENENVNFDFSKEEINFIKLCILKYLEIVVNKLDNYTGYDVLLNLYKDKKIARKTVSILSIIFRYVNNHYGEYADEYEFWESEHLMDELEDHRTYLINRASTKKKKDEINSYSYSKLHRSYNRMLLNY